MRNPKLTERQKEVARLLCAGYTGKGTAYALHISHKTVQKHRGIIADKTGCRCIAHLIHFMIHNGYMAVMPLEYNPTERVSI